MNAARSAWGEGAAEDADHHEPGVPDVDELAAVEVVDPQALGRGRAEDDSRVRRRRLVEEDPLGEPELEGLGQ
jgi:hypothetical protein